MWPWWVMIPKEDLTGVILVSEDGFWRLDWCDSGYWGGFLETWLMWLWLLRRPFRDLTDVTLVSDDILRRLDWCDSGVRGCLLETWLMWLWWVRMKVVYQSKRKLSFGEICLLMKAVQWWKLSFDESCLLMKVVQWWKLPIDESYNSQRSDILWRFACGDVFYNRYKPGASDAHRCASPKTGAWRTLV